jgi:hypothetical protein
MKILESRMVLWYSSVGAKDSRRLGMRQARERGRKGLFPFELLPEPEVALTIFCGCHILSLDSTSG